MRIIGGKYRSRRFQLPTNYTARPTTDLARESLFNILNNKIDWESTEALDLFSGTGSIAFELVSRGCPIVISVESNLKHYIFIQKVKQQLDAQELYTVKADAFTYVKSCKRKFDLIFADPPYDLSKLEELPSKILDNEILKEQGVFILEHSSKHNFKEHKYFKEERKYGSVHFSFFDRE